MLEKPADCAQKQLVTIGKHDYLADNSRNIFLVEDFHKMAGYVLAH